jgi:hypothetical protein
MQHDDRVYLRHMLDMAKKAQELAGKKSREEFERDEVLRLALSSGCGIAWSTITWESMMRSCGPPWFKICLAWSNSWSESWMGDR